MMDYCAKETTRNEPVEVCEREMSTDEILQMIRKELSETYSTLSRIKCSIDGEQINDTKIEEPKCLLEEVRFIERISTDCMGLSHIIHDKLFQIIR